MVSRCPVSRCQVSRFQRPQVETAWRLCGDFDMGHGRVVVKIRLQRWTSQARSQKRISQSAVSRDCRVDVMDEDTYEELYEFLSNNTYPDIDQPMVTTLHGISSSGSLLPCATASCSMLTACDRIRRCRCCVIRQLLQLFRGKVNDNGKLQVNIMPSTPQPSGYDCGVYAAAYATELALNNAPGLQAPFCTQQIYVRPFSDYKRR